MPFTPVVDGLLAAMLRNNIRGAQTLTRTAKRFCSSTEIVVKTKHGLFFNLRPTDYIDRVVINEGYYESEVLDAMLAELPPGGVAWDVGSNFGLHAVTLKALRPDARVFCFEPSPDQAARISRNASLNNVSLDVLCLGLASETGFAKLHVVNSGNPGMSTFHPWDQAHYDSVVTCPINAGDALIDQGVAPVPDVIKLDVENGEADALIGLTTTIGQGKTTLIVEGGSPIIPVVKALGYQRLTTLARNESTEHAIENFLARRWVQHPPYAELV